MATDSKIEWCDATWNPWEGCTKVGPGCDNCYAEHRNARFAGGLSINWGPGAPRRRTSAANWNLPAKWDSEHAAFFAEHGRRRRVFSASLADIFDNEVDRAWLLSALFMMKSTPNLDWLVLTKRVGNVHKMVPDRWLEPGCWPANIRIGATVVNQEEADRDIPKLLALPCPNFLSMEPLRGPVELSLRCANWSDDIVMDPETGAYECCRACDFTGIGNDIDWVIVGGETQPGARPMPAKWVRSLRDQCEAAGTPFLFKQWGDWVSTVAVSAAEPDAWVNLDDGAAVKDGDPAIDTGNWCGCWRIGKAQAGRQLDGLTHDGFPP